MTSVSLRVLGCGDAFYSGGRMHTCFYLEGASEPLLIDCGATALLAMKQSGIPPASIGWLALSHLHGDHFGGVPWLILDGRFSGRRQPLRIAGPPTTRRRLEEALEALYPATSESENPFGLEFAAHAAGTAAEFGPAVLTPYEVIHPSGAPAYALRIEYGGKVIAYSGDTEWTDSLIEASRGADLFICECNGFDQPVPGHLDVATLREKRPRLHCERLLITHMGEAMLDHLDEVDIEAAADGMVVTV